MYIENGCDKYLIMIYILFIYSYICNFSNLTEQALGNVS